METLICQKCEHEWIPRKADPAQCPRCKSYNWRQQTLVAE